MSVVDGLFGRSMRLFAPGNKVSVRGELLLLLGAGVSVYVLAGLQMNHLVSVLVVSLWAAIALYHYQYLGSGSGSGSGSGAERGAPPSQLEGGGDLKYLATNARFVDILTSIAPLKRFDRARFRELGDMLDAFQRKYVYIMSGRSSPDVGGLKDALVDVLRVAYSLYVVVPRIGKHFYGDATLWEALDDAIQRLRAVLAAMVEVVANHAAETGVEVPNDVGVEPANRLQDGAVAGDMP